MYSQDLPLEDWMSEWSEQVHENVECSNRKQWHYDNPVIPEVIYSVAQSAWSCADLSCWLYHFSWTLIHFPCPFSHSSPSSQWIRPYCPSSNFRVIPCPVNQHIANWELIDLFPWYNTDSWGLALAMSAENWPCTLLSVHDEAARICGTYISLVKFGPVIPNLINKHWADMTAWSITITRVNERMNSSPEFSLWSTHPRAAALAFNSACINASVIFDWQMIGKDQSSVIAEQVCFTL